MAQTDLAEAAGLHVTYISGLERGRRNPSLLTILNLAEALKSPATDLVAAAGKATGSARRSPSKAR